MEITHAVGGKIKKACGELVDEISVVRDDDDRAVKLRERRLERLTRVDVKVVGRLVEHEEVHLGENELAERQPCALAAAELRDREIDVLAHKAKARESISDRQLGHRWVGVPHLVEHRVLGREVLVFLIVVADLDVVARLKVSPLRLELTEQELDQRRFSATVRTDHEEAVAALDKAREVRKEGSLSVAEREVLHRQHVVAACRGGGELHLNGSRCRRWTLELDHLIEHLLTALGGDDVLFSVPRALLRNVGFLSRDLLLLIFVVLFLDLAVELALCRALRVVSAVELGTAVLDPERFVRHSVEKIAVVRDDEQTLFVAREKAL